MRINEISDQPTLTILGIKLVIRKQYNSTISVKFTPVTVYEHIYSYERLQKAIKSILKPFKKYIDEIDVRRSMAKHTFKDIGWEINFKLNTNEKILRLIEKKLSKLIGTKYN